MRSGISSGVRVVCLAGLLRPVGVRDRSPLGVSPCRWVVCLAGLRSAVTVSKPRRPGHTFPSMDYRPFQPSRRRRGQPPSRWNHRLRRATRCFRSTPSCHTQPRRRANCSSSNCNPNYCLWPRPRRYRLRRQAVRSPLPRPCYIPALRTARRTQSWDCTAEHRRPADWRAELRLPGAIAAPR